MAAVLPNGIEIFEVATAASMLDAPFLPVNWHLRADELAYILADADVAVVVGHEAVDAELRLALDGARPPPASVGRLRGPERQPHRWPEGTAAGARS